jgi:glycosyltransferase involved in cell wall biosynthesis
VRALYFGTYERDYPRNAQVISCLRGAGVDVATRHVSMWDDQRHKFASGPGSVVRLARAELRLARRQADEFDVLIVGYPGHLDMAAARRIAGRRPLVFNPLVSLYDTFVLDRARWKPGSLPARVLEAIDRYALRTADLVVADTENHADYFAALGRIPRNRLEVCLLGADESRFTRAWTQPEVFTCFFHGKLIPVHGLETILAAARLVPDVHFTLTGTGQLSGLLERDRPDNVDWLGWVPDERIPLELQRCGCALGIFGTSEKASRVIPNKAFEALACGAPLVTADTPGSRELLVDGQNALLVPPGDADALAAAIRRVASDPALARRVAAGGISTFQTHASKQVLGRRWRGLLEALVSPASSPRRGGATRKEREGG